MNDRISHLECLAEQQDRTIAQLNQEMFRQQQDIAGLRLRLEALEKKIGELEAPAPAGGDEKPPHW